MQQQQDQNNSLLDTIQHVFEETKSHMMQLNKTMAGTKYFLNMNIKY